MLGNTYQKVIFAVGVLVALFLTEVVSYGAGNMDEKIASIFINVKERIQLSKKTDMRFPDAYQGDVGDLVSENGEGAAEFLVTGQKGMSYLVTFPQSSIFLTTGTGDSPEKKIEVKNFITNLPSNLGKIDASTGQQTFKVGATRAALLNTQVVAADYQGSFTVRVTYQ